MKRSYLPVVLALSLSSSGCFFGNQAKVKVPAAPIPAPVSSPPPAATTPAAGGQESTESESAPLAPSSPAPAQAPSPAPTANTTVPKPTPRPRPVIPTPAAPTPGPSAQTPGLNPGQAPEQASGSGAVPLLAEILTPGQRQQYTAEYAQDVARSNAALKQTSGRNLTATQKEMVGRIRTFLNQANAARYNDLATAVQLSRRADLLSQELLKGLR